MSTESSQNEGIAYSVAVDREMCQSAATCLAFHIYELDDEVKAVLLTKNGSNSDDPNNELVEQLEDRGFVKVSDLISQGKSPEEMQALVLESAKICPFDAIIVRDKDGNQIYPRLSKA